MPERLIEVKATKCTLYLTPDEYKQALQRGKAIQRSQSQQRREQQKREPQTTTK